MKVFIDSNVPMYVAGRDHPNREPARRFLTAVQQGRYVGVTSTEVLQEILYRYSALGRLDDARQVYEVLVQLSTEVFPVALADTDLAKNLIVSGRRVSVRDAVHAAVMLNHEVETIATFDEGFDSVRGVKRLTLT